MMPEDTHPSTHPQSPPTLEDDRVSWLRLLRSRRVGPTTFHRLLSEHGSAAAALRELPAIARAAGIEEYHPCTEAAALAELRAARAVGAVMLCHGEAGYPDRLSDLPDAPPILWCMGAPEVLQRPMIALVGARNASSLGTRMARKLAGSLGERGFVVVSGLARGVDTAAHLASLETGTVAVQAGGVDVIYPAENAGLARDILARGARLSEHAPGMTPQARHFPARNRIISGLARAVIVIEAAARSGSLITARNALDQGREVLAVPGHPFDARAAGCNMLIRDGARLIRDADDVTEALAPLTDLGAPAALSVRDAESAAAPSAPQTVSNTRKSLREAAALHRKILARLGPSPLAEDQLIRDLGSPAQSVAPALVDLELDGRILRQPGGLVSRIN